MDDKKIAVLIDAENVSGKYIKLILDEVSNYGSATYKRLYGDFQTPSVARITFASAEQKPRFREKNSKPRKANRHSHTKLDSFLATLQPMWRDSSL